ncbi:TetR/AcrR family transcriptional regulator [Nitratifractor sp.]|uniref:TetR/AcrR family transcriptional regulator n=1 Tax=Nitratifractor sp. TaxID=2268144 RepID=UPI0025E9FD00|nr:TetR/AcrR family transcriptional regulator [Nitratifractor sp.]
MSPNPTTKEKIRQKALEFFSAKGYEGTTLDDIAGACGITKPAIYYHFKDKAALYEAVTCSQFNVLEERILRQTEEGGAKERLRRYITTFGNFLIDNPHFSAIFSREITGGAGTLPESCTDKMSGILERLREILDQGKTEGSFASERPFLVQMMIVTPLTAYHVSRPLREKIADKLNDPALKEEVEFHDIVERLADKILKALTC